MGWLYWTAVGLFGLAALVLLVRYAKTRKSAQLFVGGCALLVGGIFGYLALSPGEESTPPPAPPPAPRTPPPSWQPTLRAKLKGRDDGLSLLPGGRRANQRAAEEDVWSVAFSGDGKTLVSGHFSDMTVRLWDVATGEEKATLVPNRYVVNPLLALRTSDARVTCVAFSRDGKTVASGSRDNTVVLWNVATGKEKATLDHTAALRSVAFTGDGKTLASVDQSGTVRLWDVASGKEKKLTGAGLLRQWDEATGSGKIVISAALSDDGNLLAAATSVIDKDKKASINPEIKLWDVAGDKEKATLKDLTNKGHTNQVESLAFSPDGKLLAGDVYGGVRLWDVASGTEKGTLPTQGAVRSLAFSSDGKLLAVARSGLVSLWDVSTSKEKAVLTDKEIFTGQNQPNEGGLAICVALTGDGRLLAVARLTGLFLWDIPSTKTADE